MESKAAYNIRTTTFLWIVILGLLLGIAVAARPELGIALTILGVLAVFIQHYLHMPVARDETYRMVYPKRLAALSILMYMYLPHLFFKLGDIGLFIEFGVPLVFLSFTIFHVLKANDFKWKTSRANLIMTLAIASVLASMVWGYAAKGVPPNPRDFLAIKDPFYLFLVFIVFFQQDWTTSDVKRYFLTPLIGGGIGTVIIGIIQYMYIPGLNENFFAYWTEQQHLTELMKPYSRRIFSTLYSSGSYGIFLVFLLAHMIAAFISDGYTKRISALIAFVLALVALFMTASKGVFIIFSIMILLFPLVYFKGRINKLIAFGVTLLVIFTITAIGWPYLRETYMIQRMGEVYQSASNLSRYGLKARPEEILDPTSIGRITPWIQSLPMIKASPIFGYGPGKTFMRQIGFVAHYKEEFEFKNPFESSYLQIMFRFGLVGVLINFGLMIHFIFMHRKVARMKDCPKELYRVASVGVIYGLLLFVIFLNTDCIYNINLMAPVYASAGLAISYLNSTKAKIPIQ